MRPTQLALVAALLLGALLLVLRGSGRDARPAGVVEPVHGAPPTQAESGPLPAPEERAQRSAAPAVVPAPADDSTGASDIESAARAGRVRLRGVLLRSDDGTPAAGERLAFFFGGEAALVVTDTAGRFETAREVPPGSVTVTHQADRTRPERSASFPIEPRALLVPPGDAQGEVPPLELRLGVPDAWIAIEVRAPGGRPASGAFVEAALQRLDLELQQPISNTILRCSEDGRARLAAWSGPAGARAALVARMADLTSDIVELAPPWPEHPVELTLQPGAELRVRVADEAGQPVAGQAVQADLLGRSDFLLMSDGATDAAGFVSFMPLPPGRYRAQTWCEALREWVSAEFELGRGELGELTLELPRLVLQLAAAGRVVDEAGRPLGNVALALEHESGRVLGASTETDGRFEFLAEPCGVVTVALDRDPFGDEYEPSRQRVAFGTSALEFTRRRAVPLANLLLEVVDARTGERVRGAAVMVYRAPNLGEYSLARGDDGLATVRFKELETLTFGVDAPGYRRRHVARAELLPGDAGAEARVELERGFERSFRLHGPGGAPIRGAELRAGGELVATADVEGLARVDLGAWPAELAISAPGFAPKQVEPADFLWDLGPALIELEPRSVEQD